MTNGLVSPDFTGPLEVTEYIQRVPRTATIKGMFISSLLDSLGAERARVPEGKHRYVAFKDYPLVDQVKLIATVAGILYPRLTQRQAIRRLGHSVYPTFAATLVGKVMFAAVGSDPGALVSVGSKAYQFSSNVGRAEVIELRDRYCLLNMQEMYNYLDCYQVGILEGALSVLGLKPRVRIRCDSLSAGVVELTW